VLLWAGSQDARGKISVSPIPSGLKYYKIIYMIFESSWSQNITWRDKFGPRVGFPWFIIISVPTPKPRTVFSSGWQWRDRQTLHQRNLMLPLGPLKCAKLRNCRYPRVNWLFRCRIFWTFVANRDLINSKIQHLLNCDSVL
jgi:hypothetical protein